MDTTNTKLRELENEMLELDRQFESTHWAKSTDLKLDLAEIVINGLKSKGWTHEQLAEVIGVEPEYVGRIVHSSQDCSLETIGKIFHALGVAGKLSEKAGMSEEMNYNELPEAAQKEAIELIEKFKKDMRAAADEVLGTMYADIMPFIAGDTFYNLQNRLIMHICDYPNTKLHSDFDAEKLRRSILEKHRTEIAVDLNQDLLKENDALKEEVKRLCELLHHRY